MGLAAVECDCQVTAACQHKGGWSPHTWGIAQRCEVEFADVQFVEQLMPAELHARGRLLRTPQSAKILPVGGVRISISHTCV